MTHQVTVKTLAEARPRRLGRHVEHDSRSRSYGAHQAESLHSVTWTRHGGVFDQGDLGSCTGNAAAGVLNTEPFFDAARGTPLVEADAVRIYEYGTHCDKIPGVFPPDDTGSSGLGVAKACQKLGYIHAYHHAFGLAHALHALALGPCIAGINWYDSFDTPTGDGECLLNSFASVRGGHEIQLYKLDVERERVGFFNSWGKTWGHGGTAWFSWLTFARLLSEAGDVTSFVRR